MPTLKPRRRILALSLLMNAALVIAFAAREVHHRVQRFLWESDAPSWAGYAGSMQAHADFGNGVRRFYRPTPAASLDARSAFTGHRDGQAEIWSWVYYPSLGEAARASAESFADAYNKRMKNYIADPGSYEPNGLAATRPTE